MRPTRAAARPPTQPRPRRRAGCRRLLVLAPAAALLVPYRWWSSGLAHSAFQQEGQDPEEHSRAVLAESALQAFKEELPHWFHSGASAMLRPLQAQLPSAALSLRAAAVRRDLQRPENGFVRVAEGDPESPYKDLLGNLEEICHVFGFSLTARGSSQSVVPVDREALPGPPAPVALAAPCPELWIDEAWPPSALAPRSGSSRPPPVWSVPGGRGERERGLIVLQRALLRPYAAGEVKALMGHELARVAWGDLPTALPPDWAARLSKAYLLVRTWQRWQAGPAMGRRQRPGVPSLPFGLDVGHLLGLGGGGGGGGGFDVGAMLRGAGGGSAAEWWALDMVVQRMVPPLLRPVVYGTLLVGRGPHGGGQKQRAHLQDLIPIPLQLLAPWAALFGEAAALRTAGAVAAAHSRSLTVTADRAAALAAGDAKVAAAAILRSRGMLPDGSEGVVDQTLRYVASNAERQLWEYRRSAALSASADVPPGERVRELLQWAASSEGERLLALAELRRAMHRGLPRRSRLPRLRSLWALARPRSSDSAWLAACAFGLVGGLLVLPFVAPIDLLRWASISTLTVTALGVLGPFLLGGAGLPLLASWALAVLLVLYALGTWNIWWNHLLGGTRRWVQLSSALTSQLAEQADVTAGMAYLTRDWAEMARRSLAALDQELCGSWRTSLHELASKLADLQMELPRSSLQHLQFASGADAARPSLGDIRSRSFMDASPGRSASSYQRAHTAPLGTADAATLLWLKVDQAIQRTLRTEVDRMKRAMEVDDPNVLRAMMMWWSEEQGMAMRAVAAAGEALGITGLDWDAQPAEKASQDTLSGLLVADKLHQRYQYPSFCNGRDAPGAIEEHMPGADEFRRLERSLSENLKALQALRSRLAPLAVSAGRARCCCHLSELLRHCRELPRLIFRSADGEADDSPQDRLSERRTLACLTLAAAGGALVAPLAAAGGAWLWAAAGLAFCAANGVLLANFRRLSLPHVHRRFERQLGKLSAQREAVLSEIQGLQRCAHRAGLIHVRACIFLQSVNVLRNVNYILLCIKTEAQRTAISSGGQQSHVQFVQYGLRLLFWLLPRYDARWAAEILADENCSGATALMEQRQLRVAEPPGNALQQRVVDAQKRLRILFRMEHLSCALPLGGQGRLASLIELYLRPILIDGCVPMRHMASLELGDEEANGSFRQLTARGSKSYCEEDAINVSAVKIRADPKDHHAERNGNGKAHRAAGFPGQNHVPEQPSWTLPLVDLRSEQDATKEAMHQLAATRKELTKVLSTLPAEVLTGFVPGGSEWERARLEELEDVLCDLFSSVVVALPASHEPPSTPRGRQVARSAAVGPQVAVCTGFRHGERVYILDGLRTSLVVQVTVVGRADAAGAPQGPDGDIESALRSGSIATLRSASTSWWGSRGSPPGNAQASAEAARELAVPLSQMAEEAPEAAAAASLWGRLATLAPDRFNPAALQERCRSLQRVKQALRAQRRAPREAA